MGIFAESVLKQSARQQKEAWLGTQDMWVIIRPGYQNSWTSVVFRPCLYQMVDLDQMMRKVPWNANIP